jgi:hypothetical protein
VHDQSEWPMSHPCSLDSPQPTAVFFDPAGMTASLQSWIQLGACAIDFPNTSTDYPRPSTRTMSA